jgi:aminopeptidase N
MAHPVRPESYIEINNFYTVDGVREGRRGGPHAPHAARPRGFRRGMDLYFERHDGQAVTCEDFVRAMADASGAT